MEKKEKVLFQGNRLTVTEKTSKKKTQLVFEYDSEEDVQMNLNVISNDNIKLIILDQVAGVFGYSDTDIEEKNLDFENAEIKLGKNKVKIVIPVFKKDRHIVTSEEIVQVITEVIETFNALNLNESVLEEKMIVLQKLNNEVVKFGVKN